MGGISIWQLLILLVLVVAIYAVYRFAKTRPPAQVDSGGPAGVSGWLLVLVAGFIIIGPVVGAGRINLDFMIAESQYPTLNDLDPWHLYKSATWWTFLVVVCLSMYAGFGLAIGRNACVVRRAKILLWVMGPVASIVMGVLLPLVVFGETQWSAEVFGTLIGAVIVATVWTAYLAKSRRVRATYFPVPEDA